MDPGVRLGVDVGEARIGVAISDPEGQVAVPLETVPYRRGDRRPAGEVRADLARLAALVAERAVTEVVVGLPVTLRGAEGPAAARVRAYAAELADVVAPVPVRLADERMSTAAATRKLAERGVRGRRRRTVVDQAAAAEILQRWLDTQRRAT